MRQIPLFDPATEAGTYHDHQRVGYFSILVAVGNGKHQASYRLTEMPTVLSRVDPSRDTWLSQAEFVSPNRRVVNLARIGLLFADLDTYRQPWSANRTPEQLAEAVLTYCAEEGLPLPSMLLFSGRGLQAKWLLEGTIPRRALPRWNACQQFLIDRLAGLGADPGAKDASRVLRLVDTVNTRSGEVCRVVFVAQGQDGQPVRYSFEYLAEVLLPVARRTIEQQREAAGLRRQLKLLPGGKSDAFRGFSARKLAWNRLEDLRMLAKLRNGVPEGERMRHLHWRLNFLLQSGVTHSSRMYHEAAALATEVDKSWSYRSPELMTLYAKAKAHEAGVVVEFGGRQYSPLYTPKNDTLINLFRITDNEQRKLRTIISADLARERHGERQKDRRRAAGAVDRQSYREAAHAKRTQAQSLRQEGLSIRKIAKQMGVSVGSVVAYLKPTDTVYPYRVQSPCV